MEIQVLEQTAEDVLETTHLLRDTWLETYPNDEYKITKEEILQRFDESNPKFQERIEKRKQTVNQDPADHSWIAKLDGKIVGFCSANKKDVNRLQAIYVLPGYQGKGVGWKLISTSLDWLGEDKEIYVNVASYNQNAIDFYTKVGFVKTGKTVIDDVARFPSGAVIPEIEMVKKLVK